MRAAALLTQETDVAEKPTLILELTREQQLEILAATGLLVRTLERPVAAPAEGEGALARLPMPEWLRSPKS